MSSFDVVLLIAGILIGYLLAYNPLAALVVVLILVLIYFVARGERNVP